MSSWSAALDLQRRSRRNALQGSAALRRRRADSAEAQLAALAATRRAFGTAAPDTGPPHGIAADIPVDR
jgi:hypothetical protein